MFVSVLTTAKELTLYNNYENSTTNQTIIICALLDSADQVLLSAIPLLVIR